MKHWTEVRLVLPFGKGTTEMPSHDSLPVAIHNVALPAPQRPLTRGIIEYVMSMHGFRPPALTFGGPGNGDRD